MGDTRGGPLLLIGGLTASLLAGAFAGPRETPVQGTATEGPPGMEEKAVRAICTPCHAFPPPDSLPREAWGPMVYQMKGLAMQGIGAPLSAPGPDIGYAPDRVIQYYESVAPPSLPAPEPWPAADDDSGRFRRHTFRAKAATAEPLVASVAFLEIDGDSRPRIVATDMASGLVLSGRPAQADGRLDVLGHVPHPCHSEVADLDGDGRIDLVVADLGGVPPGDYLRGSVVWLQRRPDGSFRSITLADRLPRVADVQVADFDRDGDLDLVVAAFGWRWVGGIYLLENRTTDWTRPSFVQRVLDPRPGAIHVPVADLNGDGHPDFVALIAQQHETVVAFLNDGEGGFTRETIDTAPHAACGSSGLSLVDFDRDGDLDALVTNGDMLDDFLIKPYHGIRWLENQGGFPWVPHLLAGLPGVSRARAADLDGDGDLDVVACAFVAFREGSDPPATLGDPASLVWLEQTEPGRFERHTLERAGHHVSLDVGDYDGDGDLDLVVGNFRGPSSDWLEVWENRSHAGASSSISGASPPGPNRRSASPDSSCCTGAPVLPPGSRTSRPR
ncbi:MAG: VCBS repeat-containing protein [Longimicrobiales bacterium]